MKRTCQEWLMAALIICSIAIFIHGCTTIGGTVHSEPNDQSGYRHPPVAKNGPPAHAPAHGYRAKHRYRYYPSCSVYFDIGRVLWRSKWIRISPICSISITNKNIRPGN
jgi:hypothetical protein